MLRVADLTLRGKLAAVLVLPVAALLGFSFSMLQQEYHDHQALVRLAGIGELYVATTDLVHQLQLERGHSGEQSTARDASLNEQLAAQRAAGDRGWDALQRQLGATGMLDVELVASLREDMGRLRRQIDQAAVADAAVVAEFTRAIEHLVGQLPPLAAQTADPALARQLMALGELVQAKEAAEMERDAVSRLLAASPGVAGTGQALQGHIVEQRLRLARFRELASPAVVRYYDARMASDCVARLLSMRERMTSGPEGQAPGVDDWFGTGSCRIDHLHEVELHLAAEISRHARTLRQQGRQQLLWILAATLLPILPTLVVVILVLRNVNRTSRRLLAAMRGIAEGDFAVALPAAGRDELGQLTQGLDRLRQRLAALVEQQQRSLQEEHELNEAMARRSQEIQVFSQRVASGDLGCRLDEKDETLREPVRWLNRMANGLSELTRLVSDSTAPLAVMATQVQSAVNAQSSGVSQQAASINQTVTTLQQMRSSSEQTLEKATALGELAERARNEGARGRQAVEDNTRGMQEVQERVDVIAQHILALNQWTQRIGEITAAVNDIARQLRLVSLNAAVEATKAGAAGEGFAVVAAEVKKLADQSHSATEQVQHILEEIGHATERAVMATEEGHKGVERGMARMDRTGEVIRSLETTVEQTSAASRQIVAAVRQQNVGIDQIATAMGEINTVTGEFVSATDHTRDSVLSLNAIAARLDAAVKQYRLG